VGITEKQKKTRAGILKMKGRLEKEGICFLNCPLITEEKFSEVRCPPTTQQKYARALCETIAS
jgi:hypothetical protein